MSLEAKVGAFVLAGLVLMGTAIFLLGDYTFEKRYTIYAQFHDVANLTKNSPVKLSGVEIGQVESIGLADYQARVTLRVNQGVKLQEDAIASIKTKGLIGEKYVRVSPGGSDKLIPPGGKIREVEAPVDFEELLSKYIFGKV